MTENSADGFLPQERSLTSLAKAVQSCQGCDLYLNATQAVFGEGSERARVMLIGEQPGDREDVEGHPFVGPAGGVLDRALEDAGIDRADVYVTNVVKHFRWKPAPRGKRRIYRKPDLREQLACRPWLDAELIRCDRPCWCASARPRRKRSWDARSGSRRIEAGSSSRRSLPS